MFAICFIAIFHAVWMCALHKCQSQINYGYHKIHFTLLKYACVLFIVFLADAYGNIQMYILCKKIKICLMFLNFC